MDFKLTISVFIHVFLWVLLSASPVEAQFWMDEGYVINYDNDTTFGKIRAATPAMRSARIVFIPEGSRERIRYQPFQIKGYSVRGMYYESAIYDVHPLLNYGYGVFMEVLNDPNDFVRVYRYYNTDRERGFFQTFLSREGYQMYRVRNNRFHEDLAWFFNDYPELSGDLEQGMFKRQDLIKIVDHYNRWRAGELVPSENGTTAPWRGSN